MRAREAPRCAAALLLVVLLAACNGPLSELVVQVDSDIALDSIRVLAARGARSEMSRARLGPDEPPLPRSVTLVDRSGSDLPVEITVTGERDGTDVVQQRLRVRFVEGETVVVRVELLAACIDGTVVCGEDERCTAAGCRPIDVPACELTSTCDAGVPDGGGMDAFVPGEDGGADAGVPMPDAGLDAGVGDPDAGPMCSTGCITCGPSCVDVRWDPAHCNACDAACASGEVCDLGECLGCEETVCGGRCVDIGADPDHCGGCFRPCRDAEVCDGEICVASLPGQRCGRPHEIAGAGTFAMGELSTELTSYKDLPYHPICLGVDTQKVSTAILWTSSMAGTVRFVLDVGGASGSPVIEEFPVDDVRCSCSIPGQCVVGPSAGAVTFEREVTAGERVRLILSVTNSRDTTLTVSYL